MRSTTVLDLIFLFAHQIPGFCVDGAGLPIYDNKVNCDLMVGYKAVYRMCFGMACFFFLFSVIMIRVRSSKDPRASIQNGYGYVALCTVCSDEWRHLVVGLW